MTGHTSLSLVMRIRRTSLIRSIRMASFRRIRQAWPAHVHRIDQPFWMIRAITENRPVVTGS